ncbi:gamma-glutamyl-gamma-aminobutyrate hydrolase family protein [Lactobacillus jensenii]|uniref:gamma-glutamyl-gamma-aminobutyrate hydrolase family protein n=1 Tax=Lactobacillus jensenii TaxID=109790 RepID=UPI0006EEF513|nr:gamma-glutamyl-gamma-aminobutyrate hydrolase family protein [Lactobacillus jensenii]KRM49982.1 GMP synthase (glutamine-hydrolyzing) [Lactobacillus jensenii DSM 20557]MBQ4670099.1 gamma-glutamyl-gamma-aminobutyrate hydrolase family protein [Lactobacillus jensenii]MBW8449613.1 gamma-glutamyl-gamma-aminobutyrate hydrolase family protein [Lactobacillus jensenii]
MDKPIIGISGSEIIDNGGIFPGYRRSYVNEDYVDSVVKNGGIPFIIPFTESDEVIKEQLNHVQGLILSGGHDVDPHLYNEEPLQKLGAIWPERDHFDMLLLKLAEEKGIPVLGICRGFQIINVFHGGSLYQDVSYRKELTLKHDQGSKPDLPTHSVDVMFDTHLAQVLAEEKILVNSFHHLLVKNPGPDLVVSAKASDGVIEGLETKDGQVMGVQWHPEMLHNNEHVSYQNNLFKNLIIKASK